jgi:hypothetical protein
MAAQSGLGFSGIVAIQIPDDGATGEVLTKLSPDNYDYDWAAGGGGGAPTNAEYVVVSLDATLTDERVITGGTGITLVDGGANGNITINFDAATAGYTLQNAFDAGNTMDSTTQGVSIPDMTQAQRNAIGVPASGAGTLVFNTDTGQTNQWDGAAWTVPGAGLTTLQAAYDNSGGANPMIQLALADGTLTIRDDATPLADMFALQNNAGTDFFDVDALTMNYGLTGNRGYSFVLDPTGREGIQFLPDGRAQTTVPLTTAAVQWQSLVVSNIPGGAPFGNDTAPAMIASIGEAQFDSQPFLFATSLLFNQATTLSANGFNLGPVYTMVNQPIVRNVGGGVRTTSQANAVRSQMRVGPNVSGDMTLVSHEPFFVTMTVDATVGIASATTVNYFAPKAPTFVAGGTIGTLNVLDIPAIPAAGITTLRGINSAMSAGTFINHTGTAPSVFAGSIRLNNGVDLLLMGGQGGTFNETLDWDFDSFANNVSITSASGASLNFDTLEIAFGPSTVADGTNNWVFAFAPGLRSSNLAGDYSEVLFSSAAAVNIVHAISNFATWTVNAPSVVIGGGGSIVNAANVLIQTSISAGTNRYGLLVTTNPSGGTLNYAARFTGSSGVRIDGLFEHTGTLLGLYGATPVAQSAAYTPTNVTTDRSYDANATTVDELADVLGTLIADLQATGIIG